jgi:cell division transport system permease protein
MNVIKNTIKYYLRDAREGIQRNVGAAIATIFLIFISLSITGALFLLKTSIDDVVGFLNSQVKIKVFVDTSMDTEQMADILKSKNFVQSARIETKEETLNRLKNFFEGKEYLFVAFQDSNMPDTIIVELTNKEDIALAAEELKRINGITDVIYAQKFAQTMLSWTYRANQYGVGLLLTFIFASFLTVGLAINLALYQRQKDIRVKLLLGAKPSHVRGQFLFEGWLLGLIGSILASFTIYLIYQYGLYQLQLNFHYIFNFSSISIKLTLITVILGGSLIGLAGSYLSTKKLINYV